MHNQHDKIPRVLRVHFVLVLRAAKMADITKKVNIDLDF